MKLKMFEETLKTGGKWSMKRISAFVAFWLASIYEFSSLFFNLESKEYVFEGFMTWAGIVIIGSIVDKKILNKNIKTDETKE